MQVTIDISMYPNREDFIPPIKGFIERINQFDALKITTFPTSTVVQGEYGQAMQAVQETITDCQREFNRAVYVIKIIPDYEAL
ncbi:MAG: thiamine-binding protein [Porticoccaceae bacterium]|nr:thiamine-binding protein [Porticoccaceae bacterium]